MMVLGFRTLPVPCGSYIVSSASARNQSGLSASSPSNFFLGRFAPKRPPPFFLAGDDLAAGFLAVEAFFAGAFVSFCFGFSSFFEGFSPNSFSYSLRTSFSICVRSASSSTSLPAFFFAFSNSSWKCDAR